MRLLRLVLLLSLAVGARAADQSSIAGVYRGSSGIESRIVTLLPNGAYYARWDGDIGTNGTASGTWQLVGDEVRLTPKKEGGPLMPGHFRVLLICTCEGRPALLRKEDAAEKDNPFFHLFLEKKAPNQAPEPTPTAVTPAAGQPARQP